MLRVRVARALACLLLLGACDGPRESHTAPEAGTQPAPGGAAPATSESSAEPVRGDWLVMHTLADPENLNPLTSSDAGASAVLAWIFPSLVYVDDATLEIRPMIASELPEVSPDHLTYTYKLRPDVTFSDKKPLTAEDVLFALKAIVHPGVNAPHQRNYFSSVKDAEALDAHTVRIHLSEPYFLNDWVLGGISPLPRHYYDPEDLLKGISVAELKEFDGLDAGKKERAERFAKAFNADFNRRPLGAGSLVLEDPARDLVTGETIELRRRADFWGAGNPKLGDPWVDRFVYRVLNNLDAALTALKAGSIDSMGLRPVQYLKQTDDARFAERIEKRANASSSYSYIGWNERRELFQDKRVRQAMSHLVDKKNICAKVMLGLADPVESPVYLGRPEYNDELAPWPYDPAKARALLAEAGWTDSDSDGVLDRNGQKLSFEIISNSGNDDRKNLGLVVIDEMKRAGIDASFRAVDWSIMLEKVKSFDYDAVILGWTSGGTQPPDLYQIWHSSQAVEGGSNHISYKNPEVDSLLEKYRVEFDAAKRKVLYDRVQEILYDEQPYTFVYSPQSLAAYDRRFHGVTWYPSGRPDIAEWWVPVAAQKYR